MPDIVENPGGGPHQENTRDHEQNDSGCWIGTDHIQRFGNQNRPGSAGGGMVNVTATGKGDIVNVSIEDELISVDEKQMLQDLITAAANDAIQKARELGKQEMAGLTGGMQIPGLGNLF